MWSPPLRCSFISFRFSLQNFLRNSFYDTPLTSFKIYPEKNLERKERKKKRKRVKERKKRVTGEEGEKKEREKKKGWASTSNKVEPKKKLNRNAIFPRKLFWPKILIDSLVNSQELSKVFYLVSIGLFSEYIKTESRIFHSLLKQLFIHLMQTTSHKVYEPYNDIDLSPTDLLSGNYIDS